MEFGVEKDLSFQFLTSPSTTDDRGPERTGHLTDLQDRTSLLSNSPRLFLYNHANYLIIKFFPQNSPTWTINKRQLLCVLEKANVLKS